MWLQIKKKKNIYENDMYSNLTVYMNNFFICRKILELYLEHVDRAYIHKKL